MMKQTRLAVLMGGLLMGAAVGAASAATVAASDFYAAPPIVNLLAKHGADDPFPGCDDHGTDIFCAGGAGGTGEQLAKHGADDPFPECDDHGTDIFCAKA